MREEWRPIPGAPAYEASDQGRIRRAAPGRGAVVGRVLRTTRHPKGYPMVSLGRHRKTTVHSLVAVAFHGPRPDGHECNHRNGDKCDNRAANLEWMTSSQNKKHAWDMGLYPRTRAAAAAA